MGFVEKFVEEFIKDFNLDRRDKRQLRHRIANFGAAIAMDNQLTKECSLIALQGPSELRSPNNNGGN